MSRPLHKTAKPPVVNFLETILVQVSNFLIIYLKSFTYYLINQFSRYVIFQVDWFQKVQVLKATSVAVK